MAAKTGKKKNQTGQDFDHDWIYMPREKIVFVPDDLFSSRSTFLVLGRLKGQIKIGGVNNTMKKNKPSECKDL